MANLLKWRSLYALAVAAQTQSCLSCGNSFVDRSNGPNRFCGPDCRKVRLKSRTALSVERRAARLERVAADLEGMQAYFKKVERFCRGCEPGGVSRLGMQSPCRQPPPA